MTSFVSSQPTSSIFCLRHWWNSQTFHLAYFCYYATAWRKNNVFFSFTISHGLEKAGGGSTCPQVIFWTAPENALGTIITIISMSVYNRIMLVMGEQRGTNSLIMCLLQISKQLRTGGPQGRVQLSSFQHVYVLFRNSTVSKQSSQWLFCLVIYEQRLHIFHYPCVKVRGPYPKFCV